MLGSVVLVVTGGEALYADMGHFGKRPIRLAWFVAGAARRSCSTTSARARSCSGDPAAAEQPVLLAGRRRGCCYPLVVLATVATVIASQALISGAFSLTRQAVQLGYCPRVTIEHTSAEDEGQIYVPQINWALDARHASRSSSGSGRSTNLAAAYGIAVTGTMVHHHVLVYVVVAAARGAGPARPAGAVSRRCSSRSTSRSSAPTCSRSRTAAGSRS